MDRLVTTPNNVPSILRRHEQRIDTLERRRTTKAGATRPAPIPASGGSPGWPLYTIAGADSDDADKALARYVCEGDAGNPVDHEAWNAMVADIAGSAMGVGAVYVLPGTHYLGEAVTLPEGIQVRGNYSFSVINNFEPFGASAFIIDGHNVSLDGLWIDANGSYSVEVATGNDVSLRNCYIGAIRLDSSAPRPRLSDLHTYMLDIESDGALIVGCSIGRTIFDSTSIRNRVLGCNNDIDGLGGHSAVELSGTDNTVMGCTFAGQQNSGLDNTSELIFVDGTRENFCGNVVRSTHSSLRFQYGVEVHSAAVGCRIKNNDLRAGGGLWGTAAYLNAGTGTLAADNDT